MSAAEPLLHTWRPEVPFDLEPLHQQGGHHITLNDLPVEALQGIVHCLDLQAGVRCVSVSYAANAAVRVPGACALNALQLRAGQCINGVPHFAQRSASIRWYAMVGSAVARVGFGSTYSFSSR